MAVELDDYLSFTAFESAVRNLERVGVEASRNDPELRDHVDELRADLNRGLADLLLACSDEIGHPEPRLAVAVALDQLAAMLRTRLDGTTHGTQLGRRSDKVFAREALRSVCAYLQVDSSRATAWAGRRVGL